MARLREDRLASFQIEKRYIRKDGSLVWVTLTCVPLWEEASGLADRIRSIRYTAVRREHNELADRLVNEALDGEAAT